MTVCERSQNRTTLNTETFSISERFLSKSKQYRYPNDCFSKLWVEIGMSIGTSIM